MLDDVFQLVDCAEGVLPVALNVSSFVPAGNPAATTQFCAGDGKIGMLPVSLYWPEKLAVPLDDVGGCTDPRKSGAECLNWWGDNGRREALAERHARDCWIGGGVSS